MWSWSQSGKVRKAGKGAFDTEERAAEIVRSGCYWQVLGLLTGVGWLISWVWLLCYRPLLTGSSSWSLAQQQWKTLYWVLALFAMAWLTQYLFISKWILFAGFAYLVLRVMCSCKQVLFSSH